MPYVYMLRCRDGSLYTGVTLDLARRLRQHLAGRASRYTRARLPVELVWRKRVSDWRSALREEARVKSLPRARKVELAAPRADGGGAARPLGHPTTRAHSSGPT